MVGQLVSTPDGFAIRYELDGSAAANGHWNANSVAPEHLFQFDAGAIKIGEEIYLTEPDGHDVKYRVANLQ